MKFFRKKNVRPSGSAPKIGGSDSGQNFYQQRSGETPLNDFYESAAARQTRRTSRHSAAHRRENSNRASSWSIFILLARSALIVILLLGGFIVLKRVLGRMGSPSEKEQQKWEEKAAMMEKSPAGVSVSAVRAVSEELAVSPAQIKQRLDQWKQAMQLLRSAEALSQRDIDEDAIDRLGQVLRILPDNRAAQKLLADIYLQNGLYAEAVPLCIRLLDQDSREIESQMNLLQALRGSGQVAASLVLADRLLEDQPNNETLLSISAAGQIALGNNEAALALFKRMLENDDKNKIALEGCGEIYVGQNDYSNAVPYYLELVKLDSVPDYYQMLARCYAQQNQAGKAVIFMGQAASLFGGGEVSPWLKDPAFDPVRESVEFRSFADRTVGVETRKAIEALNKREAEKKAPMMGGELELPAQPALNAIQPNK